MKGLSAFTHYFLMVCAATLNPSDKIHMHGLNPLPHTKDDKHYNKKMVMKN